jgi:hypothetical protein
MSSGPRFETKDIHFNKLVSLVGVLFIVIGSSILITRGLNRVFLHFMAHRSQDIGPMASMHELPPEPRLQVNPAVDLIRMRDVENVALNNYAWIDPDAGTVRIPITRAMEILVEKSK